MSGAIPFLAARTVETVTHVTDRRSNPFGIDYPCERAVPGYGDVDADFHVVGESPGVHGGAAAGVPFTDAPAGQRLQTALYAGGLLSATGTPPDTDGTYLSYLYPCVDGEPTDAEFARLEPSFDAEIRAITAHVLLPVGSRAIEHVVPTYTAHQSPDDPEHVHATELRGGGFLVVPVADPVGWSDAQERALVARLREIQRTDYRREADLGRFLPGSDAYFVR